MSVSAATVKELRERTGAGMMDCKKALVETGGDLEGAVDLLRTKGLAAAAKKAGRVAAEGLVGVYISGPKGAIVEVNSETDFVSRNELFQEFVTNVAHVAFDVNGDMDKIKSTSQGGQTTEETLTNLIATIGENMSLRRAQVIEVTAGAVASYIHTPAQGQTNLGKIGVLVALESAGDSAKLQEVGKQIAMHVAAARPQATTIEELDPSLVAREREVLIEQAKASGKPEQFIEKMVEGRLRKYYEESVLLEQVFVIDGERRVKDVVADLAKDLNCDVKLKGFVRFALGEGIEKKEENFAEEVAATMGK